MKIHYPKKRIFHIALIIMLIVNYTNLKAQRITFSGYLTDQEKHVDVQVDDGVIVNIIASETAVQEGPRLFIAPGLIDTQVNGYASISFNSVRLTVEKIQTLTKAMWKEGVTTFFPTLITNSSELIIQNLEALSQTVEKDPALSHSMPGYFLEGPYISPIDGYRGAHQKEWVRLPDWDEFKMFYLAAKGKIIQVGVAPEVEGAMDFIKKCNDLGIVVSLAHHNGTADQVEAAVNLGARVSTHLGNGCANLINRHDNPIWPQLANENLTPSIIADGHHLRKEELKVFYSVKGPENLMLVSDATELAGMPAGEYDWNGKVVVMTEDGMLKYPAQNVLAGASFPVRTGVKNMVELAGCSLESAIQMATNTPAKVYGLADRGTLKKGMSADLVIFTFENNEMIIQKTVLQGKVVYQKKD
jgi:N-acetylglucosamine-6-phosphate deacetylase